MYFTHILLCSNQDWHICLLKHLPFFMIKCSCFFLPFLKIYCTAMDHNIFLLSTCNLVSIYHSFSTTTSVSGNHHSTFNLLEIVILRFWIWGGSGNIYLPASWVILLSICSPVLSTLSNWQNLIHSQIVFHSIYVPCFLKFIFLSLFLRQGLFT